MRPLQLDARPKVWSGSDSAFHSPKSYDRFALTIGPSVRTWLSSRTSAAVDVRSLSAFGKNRRMAGGRARQLLDPHGARCVNCRWLTGTHMTTSPTSTS